MISKISTYCAAYKPAKKINTGRTESKVTQNSAKTSFKGHCDFEQLKKNYTILASSYFRRGLGYGSPSGDFAEVIEALKILFKNEGKKKALFVGLGESQEPFSLLAQIKSILKDKSLKDNLDLNCVDLQPKISKEKLFKQSFYDCFGIPEYAKDSFVKDFEHPGKWDFLHYRVTDDIFEFLKDTYKSPKKTKWDTPIQEAIKDFPDESFDLISINNTIGYIRDKGQREFTHKNLERITKPNGIVVTDDYLKLNYDDDYTAFSKFKKLFEGIWQKPGNFS